MSDPLSEQDRNLLARAGELHRPLVRAANIARSNGGMLAVFGGLTFLIGVFGPDYVAILLGGCLMGVGIAERRAAERLRNADAEAPRQLARNELILMGAIVLYGVLKLTLLRPSGEELDKMIGGSIPDFDVKALTESMTTLIYSVVIAVAILYQGGMARYFARKKLDIARFNTEIPHWARTVLVSDTRWTDLLR